MQWRLRSPVSPLFIVSSGADERKHQNSGSPAFVSGIHGWPVNSPHKGPVTRKMFQFDVREIDAYPKCWFRIEYHIMVWDGKLPGTILLHVYCNRHYNDVIMTTIASHQPTGCLLNRLFRRRSKKTSKLRVTGLCVGNSSGPVNSPHKGPVTRKMFPFADVIMVCLIDPGV